MASSGHGTSRRTFLKTAAAVSVAGGTIALVDQLAGGITRAGAAPAPTPFHDEQYLVDGLAAITDNGVQVVLPPLYKYMITGTLKRTLKWDAKGLKGAQVKLEKALVHLETGKPKTAAGLTVVVAWGLPYFRNFIKPVLSASAYNAVWPREAGGAADAVIDAVRFGSDPGSLILEDNEIMIMIRSDSPVVLDDAKSKLFKAGSVAYIGDIINITSVRSGFVGRGFDKPSIAKQLALRAGVAGAAGIPDASQLMMGFTSTQKAALGPDNIASFETLGLTTVRPGDYFSGGAAMHLSHIYEDLALWYGAGYSERLSRMHSPRAVAGAGTVTLANGAGQVSTRDEVVADAAQGPGGHNSLLQQATRLGADRTDAYGKLRPAGTPVPVREDFNTLDQPFTTSSNPTRDQWNATQNRPGLHFVVFVPSSGRFHAARNAMDGVLPDGTVLGTPRENGINAMLSTTHRQNFLVPPRTHRSFPMAELLG
jgi:hypothetical protein